MGQHVWLLLATVVTELLVITKWSKGQFPEPLPPAVKWGWSVAAVLVVLYPTVQVSATSLRGSWRSVYTRAGSVGYVFEVANCHRFICSSASLARDDICGGIEGKQRPLELGHTSNTPQVPRRLLFP